MFLTLMRQQPSDAAVAPTVATHKSMQGYHLYTIPFSVDLKASQSNRVKLLEKKDLAFTKSFHVRANNPLYLMGERSMQPTQSINFTLPKTALPKGTVRIYTQDKSKRTSLLLGEVSLQNQAKILTQSSRNDS